MANRKGHSEVVRIIEQHIEKMKKQIFDGIDRMNKNKGIYSTFPPDIKEILTDYLMNQRLFKTKNKNQNSSQEVQKLVKKL